MRNLIEYLFIKFHLMRFIRVIWDIIYTYTPTKKARDIALKKLLHPFIPIGGMVFDVGANLGIYTDLFLDMGARVVAFEPQPNLARRLVKKYIKNNNINIEEVALGDYNGSAFIYICESHGFSSLSTQYIKDEKLAWNLPYNWKPETLVKVASINDYIKWYGVPAFIKIDTEGYEYNVLKGLKTVIQTISFEFEKFNLQDAKKCLEVLNNIGKYEYNYTLGLDSDMQFRCAWLDSISLMKQIEQGENDWQWGDIYARRKE